MHKNHVRAKEDEKIAIKVKKKLWILFIAYLYCSIMNNVQYHKLRYDSFIEEVKTL